jgi:hypothetical protein
MCRRWVGQVYRGSYSCTVELRVSVPAPVPVQGCAVCDCRDRCRRSCSVERRAAYSCMVTHGTSAPSTAYVRRGAPRPGKAGTWGGLQLVLAIAHIFPLHVHSESHVKSLLDLRRISRHSSHTDHRHDSTHVRGSRLQGRGSGCASPGSCKASLRHLT